MLLTVSSVPADAKIQKHLTSMRIDQWLREDLFHFSWWLLLAMIIGLALIWWKLVDKKRLLEICLYAMLTFIIVIGLDEYGEELSLWDYPTDIMPIFRPLTAVNLSILPIVYSLIHQYFSTWKSFIAAITIMTAVFCFIFEPALAWGKLYQPLMWKYYFGFPIYIATAICVRLAVIHIYNITEKKRRNV